MGKSAPAAPIPVERQFDTEAERQIWEHEQQYREANAPANHYLRSTARMPSRSSGGDDAGYFVGGMLLGSMFD